MEEKILDNQDNLVCFSNYRKKRTEEQSRQIVEISDHHNEKEDTEGMKILRANIRKSDRRERRVLRDRRSSNR